MTNIISPEAISNAPFDIHWADKTDGTPKCFVMDYFGKVMPHNHWVISQLMYGFVDDLYFDANPVCMYDRGNVLPDGTFLHNSNPREATAIRVLSFGNRDEDSMRAHVLHDEMLRQDSQELAEKGYLGLNEADRKSLSIALRAGLLGIATSYSDASKIIGESE